MRFFLGLSLILVLVPTIASAETEIPEFNPICWEEEQCLNTRAQLINLNVKSFKELTNPDERKQAAEGFVAHEAPCTGEKWGKCLPSSIVKTEISFAGKKQFLNIGEFLQYNYNYALTIAGILAVIMIIVSGAQWASSAGNSESITAAKHRITNAIIGLFIAYGSYFILSTINPTLVNLRVPNIWMVRPQSEVPVFCADAPPTTQFHYVADSSDQKSAIKTDASFEYESSYKSINSATFGCGTRFLMKGGGQTTCFGGYCADNQACVNVDLTNGSSTPYHCDSANIYGSIVYTAVVSQLGYTGCIGAEGWGNPQIVDPSHKEFVHAVCTDGRLSPAMQGSDSEIVYVPNGEFHHVSFQGYAVDQMVEQCGGPSKTKGFVLQVEMNKACILNGNDESHWLGYDGSINAVDLGDDVFFENSQSNRAKINNKYFLPADKIKRGMRLNIDGTNIFVTYKDAKRELQYNYLLR